MNALPQFPLPTLHTLAAAALFTAAVAVTLLLTRTRRVASEVRPLFRRRLGIASGVVRWLIIGALALVALFAFGIDLQGLWSTAVAILSLLAIGFVAMWSILSHMLAAIFIVVFRPFEIGDRVEIMGDDRVVGEVTDLNPVYTTLRTEDGGTLQIPNNLFFQKVLKRHGPTALAAAQPPPKPPPSDSP